MRIFILKFRIYHNISMFILATQLFSLERLCSCGFLPIVIPFRLSFTIPSSNNFLLGGLTLISFHLTVFWMSFPTLSTILTRLFRHASVSRTYPGTYNRQDPEYNRQDPEYNRQDPHITARILI